jgi:uncharacterized protein YggE
VLLAIFLVGEAGLAFKEWMAPGLNYSSVSVEGVGKVTAIPNIASISFSVIEKAKDVGSAQSAATEKMNAALAYVKGQGIEDKDIKTTSYSISPEYTWVPGACPATPSGAEYYVPCRGGENKITGYQVSQSVTVKVRSTDKVGDVLAGLGDLDIQNLYGPNFEIDDMDALKAEARELAIKDAKEKGKNLAKNLHVRLVRVTGFWENTDPGYPSPYYGFGGEMAAKTEAAPSLPTGENEIVVRINISYEIQ